ncbi:MAG: citrate synthase [Planctomycetes bacterium]|nr:citrate synthase [Planctomycetota bacterium]
MNEPIYSPGLEGVIAGETAISNIDEGLHYRGYAVEELARHGTFEETIYLLLYGELPTAKQLAELSKRLAEAADDVPKPIYDALRAIPPGVPMMDIVRTGASMLAHWDEEVGDNSHEANVRKAERLLAQLPVVLAARQRLLAGKEPVGSKGGRGIAANFLGMLTRKEATERAIRALDVSLVLYAEHEFNASTFTARVVCSTMADLHSAIVAAIGALKGPLHGGANERVLEVLQSVGSADKAEAWVRDALANKVRIMGFGHRVYKHGDPRAAFLKPLCAELAQEVGKTDMEQMAETIETIVRAEKQLPPNADWPSARLYHYLGLPVELYTPLFVMSRVSGWSAHIIEQLDHNRLIRPRSRYTGPGARAWVPVENRT